MYHLFILIMSMIKKHRTILQTDFIMIVHLFVIEYSLHIPSGHFRGLICFVASRISTSNIFIVSISLFVPIMSFDKGIARLGQTIYQILVLRGLHASCLIHLSSFQIVFQRFWLLLLLKSIYYFDFLIEPCLFYLLSLVNFLINKISFFQLHPT